jgi:two-component system OmpR family response regulator
VVEDEKRLAAGLKRGLEAEGVPTDISLNGPDGLWMAREYPYDAIVLDGELPGLDGYKICAELREEGIWTPIVMLADEGQEDDVEALDSGADDYVTKPFSLGTLLGRLRSLLGRTARNGTGVLRAGDLRYDSRAKRVWRGQQEVVLTAREMVLLEFMLRRKGQVSSKREILEHVWDLGFHGDPNIVEVYVGHLRNKLDRPFGRRAIETVRGAGYRLAADGG